MNIPKWIVVHHTGGTDENPLADTSHHTFEVVNEFHRKKWNFKSSLGYYIGYHHFIDRNGKDTQGRAHDEEGAHTILHNGDSIGICLAGNFDLTRPTEAQEATLRLLLDKLCKRYNIPRERIVPHRRFAYKTCYGTNLSDEWARNLLENMETITFKVAVVNSQADEAAMLDGFAYADAMIRKFTDNGLGLEIIASHYADISVPNALVLLDDQAKEVLKGIATPPEVQWTVLCYNSTMQRPWTDTKYVVGLPWPLTKVAKPFDWRRGILFEAKHAIGKYYQENRDRATMPPLSVEDEYNAPIEYAEREFRKLIPYLSVFKGQAAGANDMLFEQLRADGSKEVYLVRNGRKTLVRNQNVIKVVGDFSKVKVVTKEELEAIPDEDFGDIAQGGGSIGWEPKE